MEGLASRLFALAAAAVLLAGCASTSPAEDTSHLRVAHAAGESIVPPRASRVVALASDAVDAALALGVRPLGAALAPERRGLPRYLGAPARQIKLVGPATKVDVGKVKSLTPDLILGDKLEQDKLYPDLNAIAPTVYSDEVGRADWELNLRLYSEALGRPAAGERLLRDYDHRVARVKRALGPGRGLLEVSLVRVMRDGVRAYGEGSYTGSILQDCGIGRSPIQGGSLPYFTVPPRELSKLDGDLILLSRAPGSDATYRKLTSDPRWRALRGVRSDRVRSVDDGAWYVGQGILAARAIMADLGRLLPRR